LPPALPIGSRSLRLKDAVPGLIRHLPHHKPWMVAISVIAAVVVLATCGLGSYLLVKDDNTVVGAVPEATAAVPVRDLSSRETDPELLTAADVFPDAEIVADPAFPPYVRVGEAQVADNCRVAATGQVGLLLVDLGCNQVVRATFKTPEGKHVVTAGVFNLKDNQASVKAHEDIRTLVADEANGRFNGYIPDKSVRVLGSAPTNLSWDVRGHFLVYCVIARADGKAFEPDDPFVPVIVYDLVEKYLRDTKLTDWAIVEGTPGPDASVSPGPTTAS
jgi:hypothetical protein